MNSPDHKLTKAAVDYTDRGHAPEYCDACAHYRDHSCNLVAGIIASKGWCRLWLKREAAA